MKITRPLRRWGTRSGAGANEVINDRNPQARGEHPVSCSQ